MNIFKRWILELKRVRWPDSKTAWKTFLTVIIFVSICSISLWIVHIGFIKLWDEIGVGVSD
ncbi:MAG: preprotein translocase subunit SecE [Mollicutes bacterium PWAP]|nr:preprotein translocase subunit SecE [Mollicutes bacterium PWAP]